MQRYFAKSKDEDIFELLDSDIYHIKTVMRMQDDMKIEVVFDNKLFICRLENVKQNLIVRKIEQIENEEKTLPQVNLIIPLLKEQKMDLILQKATELGVNKITPILLNRSIIKVKDDLNKKLIRWNKICKEASEQSKRIDVPVVENLIKIEDLKNIDGLNLIASTKEKAKNVKNLMKNNKNCDKINLVIGPEGGLEPYEEQKMEEYGFIPITLGNRIMRVETVPIFIMSILNYEYME